MAEVRAAFQHVQGEKAESTSLPSADQAVGAGMDVDLPPVIVVRQMLRRQQQRKDNLHAWIQQAYNDGWVEGRAQSRSRSQRIRLLADGFDREMKAAGAFNILSSGSHDRLRLNSPKGLSIRGHFLWPVKFGRNITVEDPVYTEQHLMLVQMGGSFTPTKASIYEVPLLFSWSRHALERLSERSNVGNNLQDKLFSTSIELARTFAIMKAFDLTKGDPDLDASSLTMWLPYCDGLVIVTRQAAASHRDSRELGWKINFSKRRVVRNILRESRLLPVRTGAPGTVDANGNITLGSDRIRLMGSNYLPRP
jgi:hypothetical protein